MISIVFGDESYLIEKKLKEICSRNKEALLTRFDGLDSNFNLSDVISTCKNVNIFSSSNLVFVKDPLFLTKKIDDDYTELIEYCHKPVYETDLVFYTYNNNFQERLKIFKDISSNADVIKLNKLDSKNFYSYANASISEAKLNITKDAINYLINAVNYDLSLLYRNIDILKLYPDTIDLNVISKLISYSDEEDIYNLINALTNRNVSASIKSLNKLLNNDESILGIIALLSNQLRFLYMVDYYRSLGKKNNEIMNLVNTKSSYRIEKAIETLRKLNYKDIEYLLSKLSDLDYKCKFNSDLDQKLEFELFITGLFDKK